MPQRINSNDSASLEKVEGGCFRIFKTCRPGYPLGGYGQPIIAATTVHREAESWAKAKITDVFVLLTDGEQLFYYGRPLVEYYQTWVETWNFPIPDMKPIRVELAMKLAKTAYEILSDKTRKLLIHCSAGIGRTNMVLGCLSHYLEHKKIFRHLKFSTPQTNHQIFAIQAFKTYLLKEIFRESKIVGA